MSYQMTVSPDFGPKQIAGWYIFNTWLQKQLNENIHMELYTDFDSQREDIQQNNIDLIYANPFDASMLIREKGFTAITRPAGKSDEAVIVVNANNPADCIEDLPTGIRLVFTNDPDVHLIGMIMLEPADLASNDIETQVVDSYAIVAKYLIQEKAEVGFFLKEAFEQLSNLTQSQLKVLVESQIHDIFHIFLIGPRLSDRQKEITEILLKMNNSPEAQDVLKNLGFQKWEPVQKEDAEFMIDLMNAVS